MSFQNKGPVETGSGPSLRIEKKRTRQFCMDASEDSNKKQIVQFASDTPISTSASAILSNYRSEADFHKSIYALAWKYAADECTSSDYPVLLRKPSNTGVGNVISTGHNSAKGKKPVNPDDKLVKVGSKEIAQDTHLNNFPPNVRSLLSTGIFDGVPVKYISPSREKTVREVIKGNGYLCGCNDCKFSKNVSALEFERHADCKTSYPNNHIYFENGKTIHAVVQELKNTSENVL